MSEEPLEQLLLRNEGNDVRVLVVKGNLKHRIQKLGVETDPSYLTQQQRRLREVADAVPLELIGESKHGTKARPDWCGGGFAFLTPEHAAWVPKVVKDYGLTLQSKHIVISQKYMKELQEALEDTPPSASGPGREAFLTRRAGVIAADEPLITLADTTARGGTSDFPNDSVLHSGVVAADQEKALHGGLATAEVKGGGHATVTRTDMIFQGAEDVSLPFKPFHLRALEPQLAEEKSLDDDLLEYLTAPPALQEMQGVDLWVKAWRTACEEPGTSDWLEMQKHDEVKAEMRYPFCTACGKWGDMPHLLSEECEQMRSEKGLTKGRLLEAILASADEEDYICIQESAAAGRQDLDGESEAEFQMDPGAQAFHPGSQDESTDGVYCPPATLISRTDIQFPQSTAKVSPAAPKFHGRCATPGCPWPLGGRGSQTHCCFRCQESHKAGKPLKKHPTTGEPWRKRHGAECTSHVVPKGPLQGNMEGQGEDAETAVGTGSQSSYSQPGGYAPPQQQAWQRQRRGPGPSQALICPECGYMGTREEMYVHMWHIHGWQAMGPPMPPPGGMMPAHHMANQPRMPYGGKGRHYWGMMGFGVAMLMGSICAQNPQGGAFVFQLSSCMSRWGMLFWLLCTWIALSLVTLMIPKILSAVVGTVGSVRTTTVRSPWRGSRQSLRTRHADDNV